MKASIAILLASLAALTAAGQGFVNLDFESAMPAPFVLNGRTYTSRETLNKAAGSSFSLW